MCSNLPAVPEVTLEVILAVASPYQGVKLGSGLGLGNQSWLWRSIMLKQQSTGLGFKTLALKPMGGVNQSLKQGVSVAPQNGDIVTAKIKRKVEM